MYNIHVAAPWLTTGKYTPCGVETASTFPGTGMTCTQAETGEANSSGCTGSKKNYLRSSEVKKRIVMHRMYGMVVPSRSTRPDFGAKNILRNGVSARGARANTHLCKYTKLEFGSS